MDNDVLNNRKKGDETKPKAERKVKDEDVLPDIGQHCIYSCPK
jgi:hypothetical protein